MSQGLWKVAEQSPLVHIVLFGDQADVVTEGQQPFEKRHGVRFSAEHDKVVDKPERAGQKHALASGQPVDGAVLLRPVAHDEPVDDQLAPDRLNGRDEALVCRRQEAGERHQQHARIELVRPERLEVVP